MELLCDHQVRAVTQPQVHRARWVSHLHAEAAGDLVFHAGIAILEVVALRVAAAPELVPVAGQTAGCTDHYTFLARNLIHRSDRRALRHRRASGNWALDREFTPAMSGDERECRFARWNKTAQRCLAREEPESSVATGA